MRLSAIIITTVLAANLTYGQNPPPEAKPADPKVDQSTATEPFEAEIIHVKTLTGDSFDRLVKLLGVFGARLQSDQQLRTIVVYAPKEKIAEMRRVVAELDTPGSEAAIGRNIEMTMTLLRCSTKAAPTNKPLPDDIEPVAKQLRASTQYKDIQVWDVVPLRLQEGKNTTENLLLPTAEPASSAPFGQTTLDIQVNTDAASRKGQTWSVRFSRLSLSVKVPVVSGTFTSKDGSKPDVQYSYQMVGLNTAGDFLEGQKTVLGKISSAENDSAIFVVISLKVLD